ncbi:MAG TPA: dihydroorotate dehydrogenase, partial [Kouleothrix sp.]|nr:dihydroorotate dehydrogenase [Kouleothrix sp.]
MLDLAPHNPYGLRLSSPVLAAAGCFGYGVEYARSVDMRAIGAIVTRSTSLQGRRGRPLVLETPAGLLLAGTWPNPGLAHVLDRYAPTWAGWSTPVILSIIGANADEYGAIAAALEGAEGIAGIELNLAAHAEQSARIVAAARKATQLPLLAKLPHSPDTVALGQAAADAGADALVLFAPFGGSAANPRTGELLGGGLVGP